MRIIVDSASWRHLRTIARGDKVTDGDGATYVVSSVTLDGALGWTVKAR